jgi:hypothetical protein
VHTPPDELLRDDAPELEEAVATVDADADDELTEVERALVEAPLEVELEREAPAEEVAGPALVPGVERPDEEPVPSDGWVVAAPDDEVFAEVAEEAAVPETDRDEEESVTSCTG